MCTIDCLTPMCSTDCLMSLPHTYGKALFFIYMLAWGSYFLSYYFIWKWKSCLWRYTISTLLSRNWPCRTQVDSLRQLLLTTHQTPWAIWPLFTWCHISYCGLWTHGSWQSCFIGKDIREIDKTTETLPKQRNLWCKIETRISHILPDPATPTVAAPAPIYLAAWSISCRTALVWKFVHVTAAGLTVALVIYNFSDTNTQKHQEL